MCRSEEETSAAIPSPQSADQTHDFTALFQSSYRLLWFIASGIVGDRTLAEDVVQEAAIVALGKWDQFKPGTSFNAWMGQIVRFVALNYARRRQKRRAIGLDQGALENLACVADNSPDPGGLSIGLGGELPDDQRHFDDQMMEALGTLSGTARACLLLRTLEGLNYAEIAELLDIPQGTAMSHVHRSRRALRQYLAALETRPSERHDGG